MIESTHFYQTFGIKIARHFRNYLVISTKSKHTNILLRQIFVTNMRLQYMLQMSDYKYLHGVACAVNFRDAYDTYTN
jgi:hypothetical protein